MIDSNLFYFLQIYKSEFKVYFVQIIKFLLIYTQSVKETLNITHYFSLIYIIYFIVYFSTYI